MDVLVLCCKLNKRENAGAAMRRGLGQWGARIQVTNNHLVYEKYVVLIYVSVLYHVP